MPGGLLGREGDSSSTHTQKKGHLRAQQESSRLQVREKGLRKKQTY